MPGELHFSADLTVNRPLPHLYVDEEVHEVIRHYLFELPCFRAGVGTCSDLDACEYNTIDVPAIWERFMFYRELLPGTKSVVIQDEVITLSALPPALAAMENQQYTIKLEFKESPYATDHVGYIEFDFEFDLPGYTGPAAPVG